MAASRRGLVLAPVAGLLTALGNRFAEAGFELALVGGPVRDALLGRLSDGDLDFTTDAPPERILTLLEGLVDTTWEVGIAFGTIGAMM